MNLEMAVFGGTYTFSHIFLAKLQSRSSRDLVIGAAERVIEEWMVTEIGRILGQKKRKTNKKCSKVRQ